MKKNIILFAIISFILLILSDLTKEILELNVLLYNSLSEKLTSKQVLQIFEMQEKWHWVGYVFVPVFLFLKTIIISSIIYTGVFLFSKKQILFKEIWNVVLKAEFIFLLVPVFKIIWFYFFQTNYKLVDIQCFYPLSAINITGYQGIEQWLIYPFQTINLFELAYIVYLGYELGKLTGTSHDNGLKIMTYSYVPMIVLWVTVVMFFSLNFS